MRKEGVFAGERSKGFLRERGLGGEHVGELLELGFLCSGILGYLGPQMREVYLQVLLSTL